jgi:hypothetical protein
VLNCRLADEYRIGKDLEGSSHGLSEVLFWNLPGRTEKNHMLCLFQI